MTETTKSIKIHILGEDYSIVSDESADHIVQAAELVNSYMQEITAKSSVSNEKRIAVLGALRLASKLVQLEAAVSQDKKKEQELIALLDTVLIS